MLCLRSGYVMWDSLQGLLRHARRGSCDRRRQLKASTGHFFVALLSKLTLLTLCKKVIGASEDTSNRASLVTPVNHLILVLHIVVVFQESPEARRHYSCCWDSSGCGHTVLYRCHLHLSETGYIPNAS